MAETQTGNKRFELETELARDLGLVAATTIIIGGIIGSGIFGAPAVIAQAVGSPGAFMLIWIVGGIVAFSGALCFAELGALMPRSGGMVVYLKDTYPPIVAFLYGWAEVVVIQPGSLAAISVIFTDYLGYFFPSISMDNIVFSVGLPISTQHLAVIVVLGVLGTINYVGVRWGGLVATVSTAGKVFALLALVALAAWVGGSWDHFSPGFTSTREVSLVDAFGIAMVGILFSYNGWSNTNNVVGEVKDPRRVLPLAIVIGLGVCVIVYLAVNWAFLYVMSVDEIAGSGRIAADVAERLIGPVGGSLISIAVMISTFGTVNAGLVYIPRIPYGMAREGLFFNWFSHVHETFRTPSRAIATMAIWSAFWVVFLGSFQNIINAIMYVLLAFYIMSIIALFKLRKKYPDAERPFKVPGYPFTPLLFAVLSSVYIISFLYTQFNDAIPGLVVLVLGIPVYWIWFRGKQKDA
ncbi:MAG: amino acid permease [Gemmatimonadota bacterium]|nr:amino acid permease [Gemmatimonadota bacterium]